MMMNGAKARLNRRNPAVKCAQEIFDKLDAEGAVIRSDEERIVSDLAGIVRNYMAAQLEKLAESNWNCKKSLSPLMQ
jgi:hypothetical protein